MELLPFILEKIVKTGLDAQLSLGYKMCNLVSTVIVPMILTIRALPGEILDKLNIVLCLQKEPSLSR